MKQHITVEQLEELSEKADKKLSAWMIENYYLDSFQMSIGEMIEFLDEYGWGQPFCLWPKDKKGNWALADSTGEWAGKVIEKPELCDALWEAVKEVLER